MNSAPVPQPIERIKLAMHTIWTAGDFGQIARTIEADAEAFVQRLPLPPGARVLDVACGTGNLALPLARRGCVVTGVDIAVRSLEQARERAAAEGLTIRFDEGDAEALRYPNGSFDAVVSMFGAMFAPRPEIVTSEFARVLPPGGKLALANWDPASFTAAMFRASARLAPPPANVPSPLLWGDETAVRQRLDQDFTTIVTTIRPLRFDLPMSPREVVAFYRDYYGPTKTTFSRLDEAGQASLAADLEELWTRHNTATDSAAHTLVLNQFLEITAVKR